MSKNNLSSAKPILQDDGITHINIWSKGNTELGKMLSHFYHAPFKHPYFGNFNCMEGFWHYIASHERPDIFRILNGIKSKLKSQEMRKQKVLTKRHLVNFPQIILDANFHKIVAHPEIQKLLVESTLPFEHYYVYGKGNVVILPHGSDWLCQVFEDLRALLKEGKKPEPIDYSLVA